jgi:hypothetical protein
MQPMGDDPMNARTMNVTQRGKVNEHHQNVAELVVQRDPIVLSTIHQETPRTITQPWGMSVIMMMIMNMFSHLTKLSPHDKHGDLQPQITIYPELVHLH